MAIKVCGKCGIGKSFDQFHRDKSRKDGYRDLCKACVKSYQAEWRPEYVEKIQQHVSTLVPPTTKQCTQCQAEKPLNEYHKHPASRDGLRPICKACVKAYQAEWKVDPRVADHRKAYEQQRQQTEQRREQQRDYGRKSYYSDAAIAKRQQETEQNRITRQEKRASKLADPVYQAEQRRKKQAIRSSEKALVQRRKRRAERLQNDPSYKVAVNQSQRARFNRYEHLREKGRAKHTERYNSDLEYRKAYNAKVNVNNHKRNAILADAGMHTPEEWEALCAKYNHLCLCCGESKPLTKDHVMPLSKGGMNTIENLQPLCLTCNVRKHARYIDYRPVERD